MCVCVCVYVCVCVCVCLCVFVNNTYIEQCKPCLHTEIMVEHEAAE